MERTLTSPKAIMKKGAKTFYWASLVFNPPTFKKVSLLYSFCRKLDDIADEQPIEVAKPQLEQIKSELLAYPKQKWLLDVQQVLDTPLQKEACMELIEGTLFDQQNWKELNLNQLLTYCYQVAGAVGVMMGPLIHIKDKRAYPYAIDLGIAMQLSNICRDVEEDRLNGRVYLCSEYLKDEALNSLQVLENKYENTAIGKTIQAHLLLADRYYQSAFFGFRYLPLRMRLAISMAAFIYRDIGNELKKINYNPKKGRVYVKAPRKVYLSLKAIGYALFAPLFKKSYTHNSSLHKSIFGKPGTQTEGL